MLSYDFPFLNLHVQYFVYYIVSLSNLFVKIFFKNLLTKAGCSVIIISVMNAGVAQWQSS